MVVDDGSRTYRVEMSGPTRNERLGLTEAMLPVGKPVRLTLHPHEGDSHLFRLNTIVVGGKAVSLRPAENTVLP